jgi:hypothetical protein
VSPLSYLKPSESLTEIVAGCDPARGMSVRL